MAETRDASLGEKRERWIQGRNYTTEAQAEEARLAYNQGVIEALHHAGQLQLQHRPRRLVTELTTRPVPLMTRSLA
jgi:hypothetical protein